MIIKTDKFSPVPILQNINIMNLTIEQAATRAMFLSIMEGNGISDLDDYLWDNYTVDFTGEDNV